LKSRDPLTYLSLGLTNVPRPPMVRRRGAMPSASASKPRRRASPYRKSAAAGGLPMASGTSNPVRYFGLQESRTWIATPPWFRDWVEREQRAATLRNWYLGVLDGLLQTEDYARVMQGVTPGVTDDEVSARVVARMKRQAILTRDDPPTAWFLLDEAALRCCIGSPEVMAAQMAQLAAFARLPNVTITLAGPAVSPSPRAPRTWKPPSLARCSRTLKLLRACLPASIRSGTRHFGPQSPWHSSSGWARNGKQLAQEQLLSRQRRGLRRGRLGRGRSGPRHHRPPWARTHVHRGHMASLHQDRQIAAAARFSYGVCLACLHETAQAGVKRGASSDDRGCPVCVTDTRARFSG
jgi:uncharacterized protein DUF5753